MHVQIYVAPGHEFAFGHCFMKIHFTNGMLRQPKTRECVYCAGNSQKSGKVWKALKLQFVIGDFFNFRPII